MLSRSERPAWLIERAPAQRADVAEERETGQGARRLLKLLQASRPQRLIAREASPQVLGLASGRVVGGARVGLERISRAARSRECAERLRELLVVRRRVPTSAVAASRTERAGPSPVPAPRRETTIATRCGLSATFAANDHHHERHRHHRRRPGHEAIIRAVDRSDQLPPRARTSRERTTTSGTSSSPPHGMICAHRPLMH